MLQLGDVIIMLNSYPIQSDNLLHSKVLRKLLATYLVHIQMELWYSYNIVSTTHYTYPEHFNVDFNLATTMHLRM